MISAFGANGFIVEMQMLVLGDRTPPHSPCDQVQGHAHEEKTDDIGLLHTSYDGN